jgi:hypothetical protein
MSIWEILYYIALVLFAFMTFLIIQGNFRRKFDDDGHRIDLEEKKQKE